MGKKIWLARDSFVADYGDGEPVVEVFEKKPQRVQSEMRGASYFVSGNGNRRLGVMSRALCRSVLGIAPPRQGQCIEVTISCRK